MKKLLLLIIFIFFLFISQVYAANYPLEIINIKPAGTGTPAIPSSNRIFYAYPGIEYNIRVAVIGGLYPFQFSLSNAPEGMTIDEDSGVITWPNPQSNSGTITVSVTDSESTTVTANWAVTVTTTNFIFIDSSYSGTESGSITQPYDSVTDILGNGNSTYIVYFRSGTHVIPAFHGVYDGSGCALDYGSLTPAQWIGYPGETATIDMNDHYFETNAATNQFYFDNLSFIDMDRWLWRCDSSHNYKTVRRCTITDRTSTLETNGNQGTLYTSDTGVGYYFVFQDNTISNYYGAAVGSIYRSNKFLIEDNYIYNGHGVGLTISVAIAAKVYLDGMFVRHNKILNNSSYSDPLYSLLGAGGNSMMADSDNIEICFNFFDSSSGDVAHRFNNDSPTLPQLTTWYYRNTTIGKIQMTNLNGSDCDGPFILNDNVLINDNEATGGVEYHYTCSNTPSNCVTLEDNLLGTIADNIVDEDGFLTSEYIEYVGTRGWQIEEDTTDPTFSSASIPSGGTTTTVNFSEAVTNVGVDVGDFNLDCSTAGDGVDLTYSTGSGTSQWIFTNENTIYSGDTCTLDIVTSAGEATDASSNDLTTANDQTVTNNSTATLVGVTNKVTGGTGGSVTGGAGGSMTGI